MNTNEMLTDLVKMLCSKVGSGAIDHMMRDGSFYVNFEEIIKTISAQKENVR